MAEPDYSEIASAALKVRHDFLTSFTAALGSRLLADGSDSSPIIVRYSTPSFGLRWMMKQITELFDGRVLDFDLALDQSLDGAVADIKFMMNRMNSSPRLILLHGWQANEKNGLAALAAALGNRKPSDVILIQAFYRKYDPTTLDLSKFIGADLWSKTTFIEVDFPDHLAEAMASRIRHHSD